MTSADLARFRQTRILVIGDVMLDHFVRGNVRRISPEAPVPVVEVTEETFNRVVRPMWPATSLAFPTRCL
ncbi:hypothetical protein [Verrucomicrobium spinosum]|uniref:hypothetical protein n=1 Tax=Verrucomicrobium spinosum TaxID=2736 RepID=UPI000A70F5C7|nr:hypothetical protein [Verrucomicrobium spinosum]